MTIAAASAEDTHNASHDAFGGAALIFIGLVALGVSVYCNARFGWSLQTDTGDRAAMATVHVTVDVAAAILVAVGSRMLRRRQHVLGSIAMSISGVLVIYSMVSVYGFMSARMDSTLAQQAVLKVQQDNLGWLRGATMESEKNKKPNQTRLNLKEVRAQVAEIKQTVGIVNDHQAASISDALASLHIYVSVETVQKLLVMFASFIVKVVEFSCLGFGFFLMARRHRPEKKPKSKSDDDGSANERKPLISIKGGVGGAAAAKSALAKSTSANSLADLIVANENIDLKQPAASSVPLVGSKEKWTRDRLDDFLLSGANGLTQEDIASLTGWSQTGISYRQGRVQKRKAKLAKRTFHAHSNKREFGFGEAVRNHHALASG
jgi:lysylphosphatidylglycerol synthetase-like protein (DUF2156 family)